MPRPAALSIIGNTPLVRLTSVVPEGAGEVWLKLESGNPTGSYKDRMAISVIARALERGDVVPGGRVVEYTGGSTGTALAFVAAVTGLRFAAVFSDAFSESKRRSMEAYGAEVFVEPAHGKGITGELMGRMKARAAALAAEPGSWYADQFGSPDVRAGYRPMGTEIAAALPGMTHFTAAVGTGAALMGVIDGFAEAGVSPEVIGLEPAQSPFLTTGTGGAHKVEGVGVGFFPPFLDRARVGSVRTVDQDAAFAMCRRLAREEGLLCGGSTGLNVAAAIVLAQEAGPKAKIVTLNCDTGIKYLATGIFDG